jgi:hypothetical protein
MQSRLAADRADTGYSHFPEQEGSHGNRDKVVSSFLLIQQLFRFEAIKLQFQGASFQINTYVKTSTRVKSNIELQLIMLFCKYFIQSGGGNYEF